MTYKQLEDLRRMYKLTPDQMGNLIGDNLIRDIECITYDAENDRYIMTVAKDRYRL